MSVIVTVTAKGKGTIEVYRQGTFVQSVQAGGTIPFSFDIGDAFSFLARPAQGEKFIEWNNTKGLTSTANPLAGNITEGGVLIGEFTGSGFGSVLPLLLGLVLLAILLGGRKR